MDRRNFLAVSGIGLSGLMIPGFGNAVAAEVLLTKMDVGRKKVLADIALNAATGDR
jgi:TldD protein